MTIIDLLPNDHDNEDTRLETQATTTFFQAENGDLEEAAIGSLFEPPA